jgi:hypothetical protein
METKKYLICPSCMFELQQKYRMTHELPIKMLTRHCSQSPKCFEVERFKALTEEECFKNLNRIA